MNNNKRSLFHKLTELDQRLFEAQLMDAIRNDPQAYYDAAKIITASDKKGATKHIKYLNEIHDKWNTL